MTDGGGQSGGRIAYLCLQATRHGQASHAHVHEIIAGLRRRGWGVELFEPEYPRGHGATGVLRRLWEFARVQRRLWRRRRSFDAIYLRTHFGVFPTSALARLSGAPVITELNGSIEDLFIAYPRSRWLAPLFRIAFRLELKWADAVIAVTQGLAEWVREEVRADGEPVRVIGNGANVDLFRPGRPSSYDLPDYYVTFVGAMAVWQGVETLVEATRLPEWPSDVHLVVVGDDGEGIRREDRVQCVGRIPYEDVPGVIGGGLAGMCPSRNVRGRAETGLSPLKVFETLSCGVPVVVSDFPGQAELVREAGCGLVVPPDDAEAFARATRYLREHETERAAMGTRGRQLVVQEHSWDVQAERTHRVLCDVLMPGPRDARRARGRNEARSGLTWRDG